MTPVSWDLWVTFVLVEVLLCLTPGPAVLMVLANGLRGGIGYSLWANLGILSGNAIYFFLSATSIGAVIAASSELFLLVKWIGAAYLVWLGISTFLSKPSPLVIAPISLFTPWRVYINGLILQLGNPKALTFFIALLPQFIESSRDVGFQLIILGFTSIVLEFVILLGYGISAARLSQYAVRAKFMKLTDRLAGVCLITAGITTALIQRVNVAV